MRYVAFTFKSPTDLSYGISFAVYGVLALSLYWKLCEIFGCILMSSSKQLYHIWLLTEKEDTDTEKHYLRFVGLWTLQPNSNMKTFITNDSKRQR